MTLREALVTKLEHLKDRSHAEIVWQDKNRKPKPESPEIQWIRRQIASEDKRLLLTEVERLRATHSFKGNTLAESLGVDQWILQ